MKNINQDPIMSGKIRVLLKDGRNAVGKKDPSGGEVALLLVGAGIAVGHAQLTYDASTRQTTVAPNADDP